MDVPAVPSDETNDLDFGVAVVVSRAAGCFESWAARPLLLSSAVFAEGAAAMGASLVLFGAEFLAAGRSPNRSSIAVKLKLMSLKLRMIWYLQVSI